MNANNWTKLSPARRGVLLCICGVLNCLTARVWAESVPLGVVLTVPKEEEATIAGLNSNPYPPTMIHANGSYRTLRFSVPDLSTPYLDVRMPQLWKNEIMDINDRTSMEDQTRNSSYATMRIVPSRQTISAQGTVYFYIPSVSVNDFVRANNSRSLQTVHEAQMVVQSTKMRLTLLAMDKADAIFTFSSTLLPTGLTADVLQLLNSNIAIRGTAGAGGGGNQTFVFVGNPLYTNGSAIQTETTATRLTTNALGQSGSAWLFDKQRVAWGFRTEFEFKLTAPGGIADVDGSGADGFAFVIQNSSLGALGSNGGGLGYDGIPNSLAIEFDTWKNPEHGDPNNNHISVHTRGVFPNRASEAFSIGSTSNIPDLSDGQPHQVAIWYYPGKLQVFLGSRLVLTVPLDLSRVLSLDSGSAYVGFTAATGGSAENHDIQNFSFTPFQPVVSVNGSAVQTFETGLRLTPSAPGRRGSAWLPSKQKVQRGFQCIFEFRISAPGGIADVDGSGADGFAFVIQNSSLGALGSNGGGLGYDGIPNSLAVEFDTWKNSEHGDPNNNHISVHTRGTLSNSASESASLGLTTHIPNLSDGKSHVASVFYAPGRAGHPSSLSVNIDDLFGTPVLEVPLDLSQILRLDDGSAYVGFTAATGGAFENHDILRWEFR